MKKALLLSISMGLVVSGCAQQGVQEDEKAVVVGTPQWVTNTPSDSNFIYSKAEVELTDDVAASKLQAQSLAKNNLRGKLLADLKEAYAKDSAREYESQGGFELKLRQAVRAKIPPFNINMPEVNEVFVNPVTKKVFALAVMDKAQLTDSMVERLKQLDIQIRDYEHVSNKGSSLKQMLSILPAMPTIEESKILKSNLKQLGVEEIELPNQAMGVLLDRHLTKMVDKMVISLDATTDESAEFAKTFKHSLEAEGLNLNSRKPDLTFKYFIEEESSMKGNITNLTLVSDIELVNESGGTFGTLSRAVNGSNRVKSEARNQAVMVLASDVTNRMVRSSVDFMEKVNRVNHNR